MSGCIYLKDVLPRAIKIFKWPSKSFCTNEVTWLFWAVFYLMSHRFRQPLAEIHPWFHWQKCRDGVGQGATSQPPSRKVALRERVLCLLLAQVTDAFVKSICHRCHQFYPSFSLTLQNVVFFTDPLPSSQSLLSEVWEMMSLKNYCYLLPFAKAIMPPPPLPSHHAFFALYLWKWGQNTYPFIVKYVLRLQAVAYVDSTTLKVLYK